MKKEELREIEKGELTHKTSVPGNHPMEDKKGLTPLQLFLITAGIIGLAIVLANVL